MVIIMVITMVIIMVIIRIIIIHSSVVGLMSSTLMWQLSLAGVCF